MNNLNDFKVAVLATDAFEQWGLAKEVKALKKAGATVHVLSHKADDISTDDILEEADPREYDALVLPSETLSAEWIRMDPETRRFVEMFQEEKKPIAAISHAA